jgi:hypothetical protein
MMPRPTIRAPRKMKIGIDESFVDVLGSIPTLGVEAAGRGVAAAGVAAAGVAAAAGAGQAVIVKFTMLLVLIPPAVVRL